ncbi:DUF819 family protein [bacterium]|nr:DUF819 family protein [bacterium]
MNILTIILVVAVPTLLLWLEKRVKIINIIGPVLICYGTGLFLGNIGLTWNSAFIKENISSIAVPLAIPMLMFPSNPRRWFRVAGKALLSFGLGAVAVIIAVVFAYYTLGNQIEFPKQVAAMLTGVYTGGTPNLVALGQALHVGTEITPALIMVDTVICAIYLVFLLTIAEKTLNLFLPRSVITNYAAVDASAENSKGLIAWLLPILGTVICLVAGVTLSYFIYEGINELVVLMCLTLVAFVMSFFKNVNEWSKSYQMGEFLVLVFCVAIGLVSNFGLLKEQSISLFAFCALVVGSTVVLHFLLAWIFKIDSHTVLITSTAALFGPAFVGLVAGRLKNRSLITSGMTTGVIGYFIAFFLGLLVFNLLELFEPNTLSTTK